jgi:hypothetical protein
MNTPATPAIASALIGTLLACGPRADTRPPCVPANDRGAEDVTTARSSAPAAVGPADLPALDADAIAESTGREASVVDGVVRVTWPRTDVELKVDGAPLIPPAGLTSWAAFAPAPGDAVMVMSDTVVFEDEITAAMDAAFEHGLEVTALHNHFVFDDPPVYFMHLGGHADSARALADGIRATWEAVAAIRAEHPEPRRRSGSPPPVPGTLDASAIGEVLGLDVQTVEGGIVKAAAPREATMHGLRFGGAMGLSTWAAFSGSNERATVDGDFAMTSGEVQPVLRALRAAGLHVVALHNHMVGEEPAYYFTHYWGIGPARELAEGVRAALDALRSAPPTERTPASSTNSE